MNSARQSQPSASDLIAQREKLHISIRRSGSTRSSQSHFVCPLLTRPYRTLLWLPHHAVRLFAWLFFFSQRKAVPVSQNYTLFLLLLSYYDSRIANRHIIQTVKKAIYMVTKWISRCVSQLKCTTAASSRLAGQRV